MNLWQRARNFIGSGLARLGADLVGGKLPSAKVSDDGDWNLLLKAGTGPTDRDWRAKSEDLDDALEAWRKNFLVRQVVRLTTAYVVGDGIRIFSKNPEVEEFIRAFCSHPENKLETRLPGLCDELTRAGELFPVLFTNKISGMSQVRFVPASQIEQIETDPEDYEKEMGYSEIIPGQIERKPWKSFRTARVPAQAVGRDGVNRTHQPDPMMLHYTVNKPLGATRGESDLTPVLPWAKRYGDWLKDRVRFNKLRTEMCGVEIEIEDDSEVEKKREYYRANPPTGGSITVRGKGEKINYPASNIQGYDAEPDGKAIRLAFAAGANIPLHFLAEGSSATRSTATEMGDPTHRHYRMRQKDFVAFLKDLTERAWRRHEQVNGFEAMENLEIEAEAPDVSRADNKAMADAAKTIVEAFAQMKAEGWITDELAVRLSFKFAGEVLPEKTIQGILKLGGKQDEQEEDDETSGGLVTLSTSDNGGGGHRDGERSVTAGVVTE